MNTKQLFGNILDTTLRIVFLVAVVMFIYKYAVVAYDFGYKVFAEEPFSASPEQAISVSIAVTEDATVKDIGKVLAEKEVIEDADLFVVQELLSKYHGKIKPGVYELSSSMNAEEMLAIMAAEPLTEEEALEQNEEAAEETDGEAAADAEGTDGDAADTPDGQNAGAE